MTLEQIKKHLTDVVSSTLKGVVASDPTVEVNLPSHDFNDEEKLVNEVMEEDVDSVIQVSTTFCPLQPIDYITVKFSLNE